MQNRCRLPKIAGFTAPIISNSTKYINTAVAVFIISITINGSCAWTNSVTATEEVQNASAAGTIGKIKSFGLQVILPACISFL